jgi:hypothetical protein
MSKIPIRWKNPGNPHAMASEVEAAYRLRLQLLDQETGQGVTTPEALVAEETADAMHFEFLRIYGADYVSYLS